MTRQGSNQIVRKAVIPAAGLGTRTLPATKAIPKEMLPIVDRPAIQRVVEEAVDADIDDILLVVSEGKEAIAAHFAPHPFIDARLREKGQTDRVESVDRLTRAATFSSVQQHEQLGLGHAVLQAKNHVGGEPFLCLLGDCVFLGDTGPARELVEAHARLGGTIIGLQRVPKDKISRYGVAGGQMLDDRTIRIDRLVEKPPADAAPSDLAVAARYVLSPTIFSLLENTPPGTSGEIQLTDAIAKLIEAEPVHGIVLSAQRHDVGNLADWLTANLAFAAEDAGLRERLAPACRGLLERTEAGDRKDAKAQRPEQRERDV